MNKRPRVLMSYKLSPEANKAWTPEFQERITNEGVQVIIDEWDSDNNTGKFRVIEGETPLLRTSQKYLKLKRALEKCTPNSKVLLHEYFEAFNQTLYDFRLKKFIDINDKHFDDILIEKFEQLVDLKDEFIDIISTYVKYCDIDNDFLFKMMESAYNSVNKKSFEKLDEQNEHLHLFLNEMFLYLCAILLKNEKYESISYILKNKYFIYIDFEKQVYESYCWKFNKYNANLDERRINRLNLNIISISAILINERCSNKNITFEELRDTDILLNYFGFLIHNKYWLPRLSSFSMSVIPNFFEKLKSKIFFEKAKNIFDVNSKDELFDKIESLDKTYYMTNWGRSSFHFRFLNLFDAFKKEEICSLD